MKFHIIGIAFDFHSSMKPIFILIGLMLNIVQVKANNLIVVDFGILKIHQSDNQTFSISNDYKNTINLKEIEVNSNYTIISTPSIQSKSLSIWTIIFTPKKYGIVNDSMKLNFKSGHKKFSYTLHIKANVSEILQYRFETSDQVNTILVDSTLINLDTITEGDEVSYKVRFRNIGNQAVSIISHSTSCGCDWISYPRETVLPGSYGYFYYHYNSTSRVGEFIKRANIEFPSQQISIQFKGIVKQR